MGVKQPPRTEDYTQRDEKTKAEVFEVSGAIKWFDPSKGYGFIVPDTDLPDVLLHVSCLRRAGLQTALEGARAVCDVVSSPKGLQAIRVRSMDNSTAIRPSELPQRTHVVVVPESDWEKAAVKWFNRLSGFGFLARPQKPDIFTWRHSGAAALPSSGPNRSFSCVTAQGLMVSSPRRSNRTTLRAPRPTDANPLFKE